MTKRSGPPGVAPDGPLCAMRMAAVQPQPVYAQTLPERVECGGNPPSTRSDRLMPVSSLTVTDLAAETPTTTPATTTPQRDVTNDIHNGDDLPVIVVKSEDRPKARLQLGEGGAIYTVIRPKTLYLAELEESLPKLAALANPKAAAEDKEAARALLREFVTCVFHPDDHPEVIRTLRDNGTNVDALDMADAVTQLVNYWSKQLDTEAEQRATGNRQERRTAARKKTAKPATPRRK